MPLMTNRAKVSSKMGQFLFRRSSIRTLAANTNNAVKLVIQRTLKLKGTTSSREDPVEHTPSYGEDGNPPEATSKPGNGAELDIHYVLADLGAQKEEIKRIDSAGFQIVTAFNQAVSRIESEVKKLRDEMSKLENNLEAGNSRTAGIQDDVASLKHNIEGMKQNSRDPCRYQRLEQEISAAKQTAHELRDSLAQFAEQQQKRQHQANSDLQVIRREAKAMRKELDDAKHTAKESISVSKAYAEEVVSLKAELKQLREEGRARERSQNVSESIPFHSREIDILTNNITKIGQRASQVETLQMEFELAQKQAQESPPVLASA
ncbi:hypothetical protein GGR56DRAFT_670996 [Xylariaceae sp. FL0804]|nr:hypothetical protein GGR56DRAFT_670996 [Xylariaceae sp. FL0804]